MNNEIVSIEQIAKTAHDVHVAYCKVMNIKTQPEWRFLGYPHRNLVVDSVVKITNGSIVSEKESHNNYIEHKKVNGWKYGEVYSIENKTNPRMVEFDKLEKNEKVKGAMFFACVVSFM